MTNEGKMMTTTTLDRTARQFIFDADFFAEAFAERAGATITSHSGVAGERFEMHYHLSIGRTLVIWPVEGDADAVLAFKVEQ